MLSTEMLPVVREWIEQNITSTHGNVDVVALLNLAIEYDALDAEEMTRKQYADAVRTYIKAIEAKQVKILADLDVSATAGIRQWGRTSGVWLGMVPINLLSDELREAVVEYLERIHGIKRDIYDEQDTEI